MEITRSIDIEDAVREALTPYAEVYCAPLPEDYSLPCLLVQGVGGTSDFTASSKGLIDSFTVVIDSRAELEEDALQLLRTAVAILEQSRGLGFSHTEVNSLYSWGNDPVRPDLAMCSATLVIKAHREEASL